MNYINGLLSYSKIAMLLLIGLFSFIFSAEKVESMDVAAIVEFDELPVVFSMTYDWNFESPILITPEETYYIGIEDIFSQFDIYYTKNRENGSIAGWIEKESQKFEIDGTLNKITYKGKVFDISRKNIISNGSFYLLSTTLEEIFEISTTLNMRTFVMKATTGFELPYFKTLRLKQMRENALRLSGTTFIADTVVGREYHPFRFGVIDWNTYSNQTHSTKKIGKDSTSWSVSNGLNLNVGSELLYGEASVSASASNQQKFSAHSLGYQWRWVNNSFAPIRQVSLGKAGYSEQLGGLVRAGITNASTIPLKAQGTYTYSDYTEPNWVIELYLSNVLIDVTTSDAAGLFVFEVPISIGQTNIKTIAYGPSGQEVVNEHPINAPYAIMGVKSFQYNINGVAAPAAPKDDKSIRNAQASCSYGVTRFLTVSGGVSYLPDTLYNQFTPYGDILLFPSTHFLGSIGYRYNSHTRARVNASLPLSISIALEYQQNSIENRLTKDKNFWGSRLHIPYKLGGVSGLLRLGVKQSYSEIDTLTNLDIALSTSIKRFRTSSTVFGALNNSTRDYKYNLSASYFMKNAYSLFASGDYDLSNKVTVGAEFGARKRFRKGVLEGVYSHGFIGNTNTLSLSYGWDFSVAKTVIASTVHDNGADFLELASGSIRFNGKKDVDFVNNSSIGQGQVVLAPYLDANYNNVFDAGDSLLAITLNKNRIEPIKKDTLKRLETSSSFFQHNISLENKEIPYGAWKLSMKNYDILVDPHQQKKVYVPVQSVGEVSGMVYMAKITANKNGRGNEMVDLNGQGSLNMNAFELLEMYQDTLLKFYTRMDNPFESLNAHLEMKLKEPRREGSVDPTGVPLLRKYDPIEEMKKTHFLYGLSRVRVEFLNSNGDIVGETMSEYDGYYSYIGLVPGEYTVRIVQEQLDRLGLQSIPVVSEKVIIKYDVEGDFVDKIDFAVKEIYLNSGSKKSVDGLEDK